MEIRSLAELEARGRVEVEDMLIFAYKGKLWAHQVGRAYLHREFAGHLNEIFLQLGVDPVRYCERAYGYHSRGGSFPTYVYGDMQAAYRLAQRLFHDTEKTEKTIKKHKEINMEAEILKKDKIKPECTVNGWFDSTEARCYTIKITLSDDLRELINIFAETKKQVDLEILDYSTSSEGAGSQKIKKKRYLIRTVIMKKISQLALGYIELDFFSDLTKKVFQYTIPGYNEGYRIGNDIRDFIDTMIDEVNNIKTRIKVTIKGEE